MANACAASVHLCGVRVARLDDSGVPDPGATNLYTTDKMVDLSLSPETVAGDEIEVTNGCGDVVVDFADEDREKWWNLNATMATPDFELLELLTGGILHTLAADGNVGFGVRSLRTASGHADVSIELWTKRVIDGILATDGKPYWRWVMPRVNNVRLDGDLNFQQDNLPVSVMGEARENANWFDGPLNDFATLSDVSADRAWQYVMDSDIPDTQCGYLNLAAS